MYLSTSGVRNLCASRQRDPYFLFSFFLYICSFGSEYVHGPPTGRVGHFIRLRYLLNVGGK